MASATTASGSMVSAAARPSRLKLLRPALMLGGIAVVVVASGWWWLHSGRIVAVDDSYVRAAKIAITDDIAGIVGEVAVHEGQHVNKGDVLLRFRDKQIQIAIAGAKANMAQTALTMEAMKRDYQRALRDIVAKQVQVQSDQANFDRYANLVKGGSVTRADFDDARFRLSADTAIVESLKQQAEVLLARLGGNPDVDVTTMPQYLQAQAQMDEFQRQLSHATVYAPFSGTVTNVEATQPGAYLTVGAAAFGLVSDEDIWVEANPKETDLTYIKPGDPVTVTVDSYPDHPWRGTVDSIAPASASEFSILPAQNSSGNWVKVVQRLPVRIKLDRKPGDPDLRAGTSVEADIDTGHVRHFGDLLP